MLKYRDDHRLAFHLEQKNGIVTVELNNDIRQINGEYRFKLEDFTGCVDVNEVEIYEGDLVCLNHFGARIDEDKVNIMEIVFLRGAYMLQPRKLSPSSFRGIGGGNLFFSHIAEIVGHDREGEPVYNYVMPGPRPLCDLLNITKVIGNVNANPELLK